MKLFRYLINVTYSNVVVLLVGQVSQDKSQVTQQVTGSEQAANTGAKCLKAAVSHHINAKRLSVLAADSVYELLGT